MITFEHTTRAISVGSDGRRYADSDTLIVAEEGSMVHLGVFLSQPPKYQSTRIMIGAAAAGGALGHDAKCAPVVILPLRYRG